MSVTFKLPAQLIINNVETLHGQINSLMESGDDVVLDISEVEKADTACLQLLCVVQKSLIEIGHQIAWQGSSESLTTTAKIIGVSTFLRL
jgi:ABC-type transporter Mla MlaB component